MERYVLVPDSFKGTLTSQEICGIMREEILHVRPAAEVIAIPVADGGEGSVDAFLAALGGARVEVPCHGPYMEEMTGFYGLLPDGTAVVEMAAAAGLPLVGNRLSPDQTTTYGVGELIAAAADQGAKRIILGLGGAVAFWNGTLQMGIETVLSTVGFDEIVRESRLVFTGEGRLDSQSVRGKVIAGVGRRAKQAGVPVVAVVGAVGDDADGIYDLSVCSVFSINHAPEPFETAKLKSRENLRRTIRNIMGLLAATEEHHD